MQAIEQGVNAGVSIIATIHAESYHELLSRNQGKALIGTGAFKPGQTTCFGAVSL